MEFVDTHCHIQSAGMNDDDQDSRELWSKAPDLSPQQIINNATAAGVTKMICVGCDFVDSRQAIEFASVHENCWASIGIHPHEAADALQKNILPAFAELTHETKVVAIGECGLDYFYDHSPREQQIEVLRFQLDLAIASKLPVIFHVRQAFDDFWPIFDEYDGRIRGVLHSYTDSETNLHMALDRGLYIGVNGIATFVKQPEQLRMYQAIPLENLLFETDSPFLTPVPFRGTINEPKQIKTVATFIAELRNQQLTDLAQITTRNSSALFGV